MHVYVYKRGIYIKEQYAARKTLACNIRRICLLDRRRCGSALYKASVYKEILLISVGSYIIRSSDKASDGHAPLGQLCFYQLAREFSSEYGVNGVFKATVARGFYFNVSVDYKLKKYVGA